MPRPPDERSGPDRRPWSAPGPAGLAAAAAAQPRRPHASIVYERDEGPGGLLRFGVPDFKLEKWYIDRRVAVLEAEGDRVRATASTSASTSPADELLEAPRRGRARDRLARAPRARRARRATWRGVRFAMDYLYARNRWVARGRRPRATTPS